ncbi:MAG TPA: S41 family peptidase [Candidatus Paceibacterota bacterium]|nr:S41 family peptidase [Candidatus Paceibacterota bacterium]
MRGNKFLKISSVFLLGVAVGAAGLYGGFLFGLYELPAESRPITDVEKKELLDADFGLFWDSVKAVKENYFKIGDVRDENLLYGAIEGLIGALDDPYSSFFNPSDAKKFEEDIQGSFGGIGAEIGIRNDQLVVIAPLKGNPAEAAGLKAGDKILKVDDIFTNDLTVEEAVKIIRGEPGTVVTLLIIRNGWDEAKEFKITRAIVVVPTLDWEMKPGNIAYFHLYNFNANAPSVFYQGALEALVKGARGIVLDLRDNPGGYLEVAQNIASWFLERGEVVVRERFRSGNENLLYATGPSALAKIPTVIIVNGGSASASEIVAGALRDIRGVKIIGEKTFGKGTVQEVHELSGGSSIKVSVAEWLTPAGNVIEKEGLIPDFEVKVEGELAEGEDPQLAKALEILNGEIESSGGTIFVVGY